MDSHGLTVMFVDAKADGLVVLGDEVQCRVGFNEDDVSGYSVEMMPVRSANKKQRLTFPCAMPFGVQNTLSQRANKRNVTVTRQGLSAMTG